MPIYEYKCDRCDHCFEKLVFSEGEPVTCPECSSKKARKLMSCVSPMGAGGDQTCGSRPSGGFS